MVGVSVGRDGRIVATIGGGPQDVNKLFETAGPDPRPPHAGGPRPTSGAYQVTDPDPTDLDQPPNPTESNPYGIAAPCRAGGRS